MRTLSLRCPSKAAAAPTDWLIDDQEGEKEAIWTLAVIDVLCLTGVGDASLNWLRCRPALSACSLAVMPGWPQAPQRMPAWPSLLGHTASGQSRGQPGQSEDNHVEGYAPYGVVQLPVRWNIFSYHYIPVVRAGC